MSKHIKFGHLLILSLFLAGLVGCAGSRPPVEGVWEKIEPVGGDGGPRAIKILTEGHFAFGAQSLDGLSNWSGGGTYTFDGQIYSETIAYHWNPKLVGRTIDFSAELKNGLWHHQARFTIDDTHFNIDEVWRRVAPTPE